MATVLGPDVSHWQGTVDWPKVRAGGYEFAILKATESTNYVDPTFAANRARARAAGLLVGAYHFARATDPVAEADFFVSRVGSLAPGEFVVLDWEVPYAQPPVWCLTWLQRVRAALGTRPLVYMNQSAARGFKWKAVIEAGFPLWLAKYDLKLDNPGVIGEWPKAVMKQHTDKGTVPGIAGAVDLNVFYGDKAALKALAQGGSTTDEEDDMLDADRDMLTDIHRLLGAGNARAVISADDPEDVPKTLAYKVNDIQAALTVALPVLVADAQDGDSDPDAIAAAVVGAIPVDIAERVIDLLGQKLSAAAAGSGPA